jgi:hypothetical protein
VPERPWPEGYGVWPALALFFFYRWVANAFPNAYQPGPLAALIIGYSLLTLAGMLYFGTHTWLRYGDPFSVFFRLLARLSPTEVRVRDRRFCQTCRSSCSGSPEACVDCYECFEAAGQDEREVNLRPYAAGLSAAKSAEPGEVPFVLLVATSLAFDGFRVTRPWVDLGDSLGFETAGQVALLDTLGLMAFFAAGGLVYLLVASLLRALSRTEEGAGPRLVYAMLPIAIAYLVAHSLRLLLIEGQLIVPLASDPFGLGWNIFGTTGFRINFGVAGVTDLWGVQAGFLLLAAVTAVYVFSTMGLTGLGGRAQAIVRRFPLAGLTAGYTILSLWLLWAATPGKDC